METRVTWKTGVRGLLSLALFLGLLIVTVPNGTNQEKSITAPDASVQKESVAADALAQEDAVAPEGAATDVAEPTTAPEDETPRSASSKRGLGEYGTEGPITRDQLEGDLPERVTEEALTTAMSEELAPAREDWNQEFDFVHQIDYQLRFRNKIDYLDSGTDHLADVLEEKPENVGSESLGLYMTEAEAQEFERRQEVGDRIPTVASEVGRGEESAEGDEPEHSDNFAGTWQDQNNGGKIVVAVVDASEIDEERVEELAGGEENIEIVEVEHSWDDVEGYRDAILEAIEEENAAATVYINAGPEGRTIEITAPQPETLPESILKIAPDEILTVTEGELPFEDSEPNETHAEVNQQPGLLIFFNRNSTCTWGANAHSKYQTYLITAGHCGDFDNFRGWNNNEEIYQNNSFHLTPGPRYIYSIDINGWDMKRVSTPQADSNCYHADSNCARFIRYRARHNSWEPGSDLVCASLGRTNSYECGVVLEENYRGPATGECSGSRYLRYDIDTSPGDSGSGLIGPVAARGASIDAIHSCGAGPVGFGNTAYDVRQQLKIEFNCAPTVVRNRPAGDWGRCPSINR